jgi:hypothetical protein
MGDWFREYEYRQRGDFPSSDEARNTALLSQNRSFYV